ncbi:MAG: bifunctional UDP-4-keto-pentose/UDP-xylose synthase [Magnetospirillum sp.]|nr:bifunctional UDP-4-keto-pentose/UDP-xylose synthase [Magnetospirillum sp.]
MSLKILILGVNGFVGSNLSERILKTTDWSVYGMDIRQDKIEDLIGNPRFHFVEGDITINREWVEYHVKKCDVILPLVAIATPATYVQHPLKVFELDFEANLAIVRDCVKYDKRVLFPSTSEVYGMSTDTPFDEETSNFVLGPIHKQRWIYSCSKQLLDRVIYAYGAKGELRYTLFRPFNWIGPKLDNIWAAKEGSSRVLTQFVGNIVRGENISLVAGGAQRRCFLYIDDALDAMVRIIANKDGCADGRIFNIGDPRNDYSMRALAETLLDVIQQYDGYADVKSRIKLVDVDPDGYYGKGYEDIQVRVPSIENAAKYLGWTPTTDLRTALKLTLDYYLLAGRKDTGDLTGTPV